MLFVAIAICVLAVLCGLVIVGRSAIGASRRLARLDEAITTGAALAVRAQELRTRAEQRALGRRAPVRPGATRLVTRVAVVDLGTNSTRLLVADVESGAVSEVERVLQITRLGEGVDAGGTLGPSAIARVLDTLDGYAGRADALGAGATGRRRDERGARRVQPRRAARADRAARVLGARADGDGGGGADLRGRRL